MAKTYAPYRFSVDGIDFDLVFTSQFIPLEYGNERYFKITLAYARRVGTVETLAAKAIRNPKDIQNEIQGQRLVFKRLMQTVWTNWCDDQFKYTCKEFVQHARNLAFDAGMWNDEE